MYELLFEDKLYCYRTRLGPYRYSYKLRSQGKAIQVDGLISVPHSVKGPVSKNVYTILILNEWFQKFGKAREDHGELKMNIDITAWAKELFRDLIYKKVTNKL